MPDFMFIFNQYLVPLGLGAIMFGLGLTLTVADFKRVVLFPRAAATGLSGQLILLPLVAVGLSLILPMPPELAIGMVILAACPGGVSSNAFVFAMRGDVALSVTMTAISSMITAFTIPFLVWLGLWLHGDRALIPDIPVLVLLGRLLMITALPVIVGMIIHALAPVASTRTARYFRPGSLIFLAILIVVTTLTNYDALVSNLRLGIGYSLLLNLVMMGLGFLAALAVRLDRIQEATISYEIGLQNAGLAIVVTRSFMDMPALSIFPIIYGVLMMITAFFGVLYIRRYRPF